LLTACDIRDKYIQDVEMSELEAKLTTEEYDLVSSYLFRHFVDGMMEAGPDDRPQPLDSVMAVREVMKAEIEARHADSDRVEEEKLERERKAKEEYERLMTAVEVTVTEKGFVARDWRRGTFDDLITYTAMFKNNTDKRIIGVKGALEFYD